MAALSKTRLEICPASAICKASKSAAQHLPQAGARTFLSAATINAFVLWVCFELRLSDFGFMQTRMVYLQDLSSSTG
jgi:hypothetical protein